MINTEEFLRFKNGHLYTITFDSDGIIDCATIYVVEMDEEVDVTRYIQDDSYWQARVAERLAELRATANERKYWDAYKDVCNR